MEPGSSGSARPHEGYDDKARTRGQIRRLEELEDYLKEISCLGIKVYGAVLVLLSGNPPQVLLERKSCKLESYWACDVALPGGKIEEKEDPVWAALREAWEEVRIPPAFVKPVGFLEVHRTVSKPIYVLPIIAVARGPIDPLPSSPEIDMAFWIYLDYIKNVKKVRHPRRGEVLGVRLAEDVVLWGLTLRILQDLMQHNISTLL